MLFGNVVFTAAGTPFKHVERGSSLWWTLVNVYFRLPTFLLNKVFIVASRVSYPSAAPINSSLGEVSIHCRSSVGHNIFPQLFGAKHRRFSK